VTREHVVLDASVGVKWIRRESGSDVALRLVERHVNGEITIVVPVIFVHEVLDVIRRRFGVETARTHWKDWREAGILVAGIDDALVGSALEISGDLGCTLYDAMAPALAQHIGAPLYSADRRAHGTLPYARLIG